MADLKIASLKPARVAITGALLSGRLTTDASTSTSKALLVLVTAIAVVDYDLTFTVVAKLLQGKLIKTLLQWLNSLTNYNKSLAGTLYSSSNSWIQ
jgi:hypothetical protein